MANEQELPVLLKLSGKVFSPTSGFDGPHLESIGGKIQYIMKHRSAGLAIVTGAGNIYRGREGLGLSAEGGDRVGMIGTMANGEMLAGKLDDLGIPNVVMCAYDPAKRAPAKIDYSEACECMMSGCVVIFTGGTGSPGVTTDTAAAMHAGGCGIKTIWMAKDLAHGVFDDDPNENPNAKHFPFITITRMRELGLGVMDDKALEIALAKGITHLVFRGDTSDQWQSFVIGQTNVQHSVIQPE